MSEKMEVPFVYQKSPGRVRTTNKTRALDKRLYAARAKLRQAGNCIFPTLQLMTSHIDVYELANCSCDSASNQPTVTAERCLETKFCIKLAVLRFCLDYVFP